VDDLLWVEAQDGDAFRRGLLRYGEGYVATEDADRIAKPVLEGYVLRTDHIVLRTNVAFARARDLAQLAEDHVTRVLEALGAPLDLRFPADPIPVVVASRCPEFRALLVERVAPGVEWGAFYQAVDGTVYACDERKAEGGLPVAADLRHELTHAILDLGRPERGRRALFARPHFWAWEGIAMWSESLGDPAGSGAGEERIARFKRRLAWNELVPVEQLAGLTQDQFVGRHYDEAASLMTWLLDGSDGARRAGTLALVSRVMDGQAEIGDFERLVGISLPEAQRLWLASLGHAQ
jgi:hypothetical protein